MAESKDFQSITRFVVGDTNPFMDVPLPAGQSVTAPQTIANFHTTLGQPCSPTIPDPNSSTKEYQFAYWVVVGGKPSPAWGFNYTAAPKVDVEDRDVTNYAVYYSGNVSGSTVSVSPRGLASAHLGALDYSSGLNIVGEGNFFEVLSDPTQDVSANGQEHSVLTQSAGQLIEAKDRVNDYFFMYWIILGPNAPTPPQGPRLSVGQGKSIRAFAIYTDQREDLRFVRGTVDRGGVVFAGKGYSSARRNEGEYLVTFVFPFPSPPSASATLVFNGNSKTNKPFSLTAADGTGANRKDNAVIVWITTDQMLVVTGDKDGDPADRPFSFIVAGPQSRP